MVPQLLDELPAIDLADSEGLRRYGQTVRETACRAVPREARPIEYCRQRDLKALVIVNNRAESRRCDRLVSRWGHEVGAVHQSLAAVELARAGQPDVVLLGVDTPLLGGCTLAGSIRCELAQQDCLIVAVAGQADRSGGQRCREAGIDVVLFTPVDQTVLETLLWMECTRVHRLLTTMGRLPMYPTSAASKEP